MLLKVNGQTFDIKVEPEMDLLTVLRNHLDLTGSKYGCGEGACGACTVLIDGKPARSCVVNVGTVSGKEITTIEGLQKGDKLHPVQEAFLAADPFQCAYCAPGMIMSAVALLQKDTSPTEETIINAMNGNICRCGTYPHIVAAIRKAAASKTTR